MQKENIQVPRATYDSIHQVFQPRDVCHDNARRLDYFVLEYDLPVNSVQHYYNLLVKSFVKYHDRYIVMGTVDGASSPGCCKFLALIRKSDHSKIAVEDLEINGVCPLASYVIKSGNGVAIKSRVVNAFNVFAAPLRQYVCGMEMVAAGITYTFDYLLNMTSAFSDKDLSRLFANIVLTAKDDRNELHLALLKVESRIMAYRARAQLPGHIVFQNNMQGVVQPLSAFIAEWASLPVRLADASIIGTSSTTLGHWMQEPKLHQNLTLLMRGKTRSGKSEFSKVLAMMLAMRYHPDGHALFLFLTTIEAAKECKEYMQPGVPVIFDDIDPSDKEQLVHTSLAMWKALLQGANPFTTRARNEDINWSRRQPKLITSNAKDVDAWLGKMGISSDRSHVEAIEMRLADLEIPGSLFLDPVSSQSADALIGQLKSHDDVLKSFNSMF